VSSPTDVDAVDPAAPLQAPTRRLDRVGLWVRAHPRWSVAGVVVLVLAFTAAADWPHRATQGQLQGDLQDYVTQARADVLSCGVEVEETLSAYNQITAGVSTDRSTAIGIADRAALDCTPAGNDKILDLAATQPPRSLAKYRLDLAAAQLYGWASADAVDAMQDVHALLVSPGDPARLADVNRRLGDMQQSAASAQGIFDRAAAAVGSPSESLSLDAVRPGVLVG
jgi:hypothetical protein